MIIVIMAKTTEDFPIRYIGRLRNDVDWDGTEPSCAKRQLTVPSSHKDAEGVSS